MFFPYAPFLIGTISKLSFTFHKKKKNELSDSMHVFSYCLYLSLLVLIMNCQKKKEAEKKKEKRKSLFNKFLLFLIKAYIINLLLDSD